MKMTKIVKVTVDINIARRMLRLAHNKSVSHLTDDEVFEEVINMNSAYGAKSFIESD